MFTFTITNPAAPQNANPTPVYLGQANTLEFHFQAGMHEQTQAGDQITIVLDQRLLDNPASLKVNSDYWKLGACTAQGNTYVLRCDFLAAVSLSEPFALQLEGLTPVSACVAQVNIQARFGGRPYSGSSQSLAVMNPPSAHKDLREVLSFELLVNDFQQEVMQQFYLSDADLQTPIANTLHLIVTCSTPPLTYDGNGPRPVLNLSFTYGEDQYSLTDALKNSDPNYNALSSAWNIACQVGAGENDRWQAIAPNAATATPNWQLAGNAGNLFRQSESVLDVFFSHVISRLPEGTAVLYIQWINFKGYDDGVMALPIAKYKASAQVLAFNSPQNNQTIAFGQPVTLNWTVFGGKQVAISWDNGLRHQNFPVYNGQTPALTYSGEATVLPDSHEAKFYIAQDGQAADTFQVEVTVSDFPPPQIKTFEGALTRLPDDSLVVQLNVLVDNLGNNGVFEINGQAYNAGNYNGLPFQLNLPAENLQFPATFNLHAIDKDLNPNTKSSSSISVDLPEWIQPQIKSFSGVVQKDGNGQINGLSLQFQLGNIYPFTKILINEIPVSVGADGSGQLHLPVNAQNPIVGSYILACTNPIVAPALRTVSLQYIQTNSYQNGSDILHVMAVCVQRQSLLGLFSGDQLTIKECPLNAPGSWDSGVVFENGSDAHIAPFSSLVMAPDGSQALLCGHSFYGLVYENNQWKNNLYLLTQTDNTDSYVGLPGAYAPDMRLAFINGYYNVSYFKPDPSTYQLNAFVPVKTVSANYLNATGIAVTHDGNRVFVCDPTNQKIWYFDTNNIPENFSAGIDLPSGGEVLVASSRDYLYFTNGRQIFGVNTADTADNMRPLKLADLGLGFQEFYKLQISADGTLLIFKGFEAISVFYVSVTNPSSLLLLNDIKIEEVLDVAISPDNTRIFISTLNELLVYEAQFVQQGA
ncbi:MAG: hypothetical protein J0L99_04500 [Chitinophagales bacterium]|nr:hypothetical protein [Chitinophagales bacterium]